MNAPFSRPRSIGASDRKIIFFAWRGAVIELFGRGEVIVAKTLEHLVACGTAPNAKQFNLSAQRLNALRSAINGHDFGRFGPPGLKALQDWEALTLDRPWFAHGVATVRPGGMTLTLKFHRPKNTPESIEWSLTDTAVRLSEMTKALRSLSCQMGSIRSFATKRTKGQA